MVKMNHYSSVLVVLVVLLITIQGLSAAKQKEAKINYKGYSVFKIPFESAKQKALLERLTDNRKNFVWWNSRGKEIELLVAPKEQKFLRNLIKTSRLTFNVTVPDVQNLIDAEQVPHNRNEAFGWTSYYPLSDIYNWLDTILARFPHVTKGFVVGESYEGRIIRGLRISYKKGNPGIFIESNIHAREWITSATATWFINELLTSTDPAVRDIAENIDWYIVPVFNVDGFTYSHEVDRMWRKTRQPHATSTCIGADANRNWDSYWMANSGASSNPCSETFAGPNPHSEPEVQALADLVEKLKHRINLFFAFHSYGQYVLTPYGHTALAYPTNYNDYLQAGKAYVDAVYALPYQTVYTYGSTAAILYVASGTTSDWAFNEKNISMSCTIEFRDKGRNGFVLPPDQIIPNCEETMAGLLAFIAEAKKLNYLQLKYEPTDFL